MSMFIKSAIFADTLLHISFALKGYIWTCEHEVDLVELLPDIIHEKSL